MIKKKKLKSSKLSNKPKKPITVKELLKKYPYLNKHRNIKTRQEYIDIDDKFLKDLCLDETAAKFYNQFCKEFYNADYSDHVFVKEGTELKKQLNKEHYARQVCIFNIKRSTGLLSTYKPEVLNKKDNKDD